MRNSLYTFGFAAVLGLICAIALTATARFVQPRKEANERAEMARSILGVLDMPLDPRADSQETLRVFDENLRVVERYGLTLYLVDRPDEENDAPMALTFSGPGVWGPIEGALALESDMKTIRGISFFRQEETPGLGGEIGAEWFTRQFQGKSIEGPDGKPGIRVVPNPVARNEVDAITGATETSKKVQAMLNSVIERLTREEAGDGVQ